MKKCEKCGDYNDDTAAVCKSCGEVLPITETWAASLRQSAKSGASGKPSEKGGAAKPKVDATSWGSTLAGMGMALTICSFIAGAANAGIVLSLGVALSVGAAVRLNVEGRKASAEDDAWLAVYFSFLILVVLVGIYFGYCWHHLYPYKI